MSEKAKKKSSLLPWKEAAHINIKAMKLLWGEYPQMFADRKSTRLNSSHAT